MLTRSAFPWTPVAVAILAACATAVGCGGSVTEPPSNQTGGSGGSGGTGMGGTAGSPGTGGTGTGGTGMGGTGGVVSPEAGPEDPPDAPPTTDLAVPPAPPSGGSAGNGPGVTLAMNRMLLGDTTVDGTPSTDAWRYYGYDIDGQVSNKTSPYHCKENPGANKSAIQTDGPGGIDNSWGYNILPIMLGLASDFSTYINEDLHDGVFTSLYGIDAIGSQADYVSLPAALYQGASLGHTPSWTTADSWPVTCESLMTCLPSGTPPPPANASKTRFANSYVTGGTWVSGQTSSDIMVPMQVAGYPMPLHVHQAVVTMRLVWANNGAPTGATGGVISGVINTEELIAAFAQMAGSISTSLCEGPTMESVAQQIRAASDILTDGTQDPNKTCNAISIGLGFDARAVTLGAAENQQPAVPDPCAY